MKLTGNLYEIYLDNFHVKFIRTMQNFFPDFGENQMIFSLFVLLYKKKAWNSQKTANDLKDNTAYTTWHDRVVVKMLNNPFCLTVILHLRKSTMYGYFFADDRTGDWNSVRQEHGIV